MIFAMKRIVFGKIDGLEANPVWIKKESWALDTQEDESKEQGVISAAAANEKKEKESKEGDVSSEEYETINSLIGQ